MNRHFQDTWYYLKRAATTAKAGLTEEAAPISERVRKVRGHEEEPAGRVERLKADLADARATAEREARAAVRDAREAVEEYRGRRAR